jgi:Zn-dependent protease with chaperone function
MIYIQIANEQKGPFKPSQIKEMLLTNEITLQCLAWKEGYTKWVPISEILAVLDDDITASDTWRDASFALKKHHLKHPKENRWFFISNFCIGALLLFAFIAIYYMTKEESGYNSDFNLIEFIGLTVIIVGVILIVTSFTFKMLEVYLLADTVRMTSSAFPRIIELCKIGASRIGVKPPNLYLMHSEEINASTIGMFGTKRIIFTSKAIEELNEEELLFLIGHELAHIKFGHTFWNGIAGAGMSHGIPVFSNIAHVILKKWLFYCEYTCDRTGLYVSKSIEASCSTLIKAFVGSSLYHKIDKQDLLNQANQIDKIGIFGSVLINQLTHPPLPYRIRGLLEVQQKTKR